MTEKTIPELPIIPSLSDISEFVVDSNVETFRVSMANLALFIRDSIIPAGITAPFAGSVTPDGWLLCYGQEVSRSTYARLFAAIGTAFGTGNGSTTFNLPDCRGRVIAGKDDMGGSAASRLTNAVAGFIATTLGAAGGSQTYTPAGSIGGSQSIAHTHNISHTHQWGEKPSGAHQFYSLASPNPSATSISGSDSNFMGVPALTNYSNSGALLALAPGMASGTSRSLYTTGALFTPSGSGANAASGSMSTNTTVNGSNFTFTGTAGHRVQPTIIMNTIIKI